MTAYFCDGLKDLTILNGVVRLELQRLQPLGHGGETRPVSELHIAMPLQGLVGMFGAFSKVKDELIREGILKPEAINGSNHSASEEQMSPNFS